MAGTRGRWGTTTTVLALVAAGLASVVTAPPAVAVDAGPFEVVEVATGGRGFRSGPADEIGMQPYDLAALADGTVVVADEVLRLIDPVAGTNTVVAGASTSGGVPSNMQFGPDVVLNGVASGAGDALYANVSTALAPWYPGQLVELDLDASTITPVAGGGNDSWGDGQPALGTFLLPSALSGTPDGSVLFFTGTGTFGASSIGPAIVALDPLTGTLTRLVGGGNVGFDSWDGAAAFDISLSGLQIESIAQTPDGSIHFISTGRIWRADAASGLVEAVVPFTAGLPSGPRGLGVGTAGALLSVTFSANGDASLVEIDTETGATEPIAVVPVSPDSLGRLTVAPDGAAFLFGREGPASRRDNALLRVAPAGAVTVEAGNGANDRWQGDGAPFTLAFFPPVTSSLFAGPDDRIYTLRDEGIAVFDPTTSLTTSVHVPGLITQWSVYAQADILGFASDGRLIVRSIVPTGPVFGDYAVELVDLTTAAVERVYGPTAAPVRAAGGPNGDVYVLDSAAGQTVRIDGAGTETVVGDAPGDPAGLWITAAGELFADFGGLRRLEESAWTPLEVCVGEYGYVESAFVQDGAGRFVAARTDPSFNVVACRYDPVAGVTTDIGPAPAGIPNGNVDSEGFVWYVSDTGIAKMLVRPTGGTPQHTLTVTRSGTGAGAVASTPSGIACGATCTAPFDEGTLVTLTATADPGSTFTGWSGACAGAGTCQVTMSAARNVDAAFGAAQWPLSVARNGTGSGVVSSNPAGISCGGTCTASYANATPVTLTATADPGSTFTGWSGACTGAGTCQVTMSAARNVTAGFAVNPTANLRLTIPQPTSVGTGTPFSIPFVVANLGPSGVPSATLTGTLDANLVLTGPLPTGCTQPAGPTSLSCTTDAIPAGQQRTLTLPVRSIVVGATCTVWGTSGNDAAISGTTSDDVICGLGGSDTITGLEGFDVIYGDTPPEAVNFTVTTSGAVASSVPDPVASNDTATVTTSVSRGAEGGDTIAGGPGGDLGQGQGGDDTIRGDGDDDELVGGLGRDTVYGNDGRDTISGDVSGGGDGSGVGDALLDGGAGNDVVSGQGGDDTIRGQGEDDELIGGMGSDTVAGGSGDDRLYGDVQDTDNQTSGTGDALLDGGPGADVVFGQGGNDTIYGDVVSTTNVATGSDDRLDGGAGNDSIYAQGGADYINAGRGRDSAYAGNGDDTISGDNPDPADDLPGEADLMLDGGAGNDDLYGHGGDDVVVGGTGADLLWGGVGNDQVYGDVLDATDVATGSADQVVGGAGNDRLYGQGGGDRLSGDAGADTLQGGDGADQLTGDGEDDVLIGGASTDSLFGGSGADRLYGDTADATDVSIGSADELQGGTGNDRLYGQGGADRIFGEEGEDTIDGGDGADELSGGEQRDTIDAGTGADHAEGGADDDTIDGAGGDDRLLGRAGNDRITGGPGIDVITGEAGNDWIRGDAGTDWLYGDEGVDDVAGGAHNDVLSGGTVPGLVRNELDGGAGTDCAYTGPDNRRNIEQSSGCAPRP